MKTTSAFRVTMRGALAISRALQSERTALRVTEVEAVLDDLDAAEARIRELEAQVAAARNAALEEAAKVAEEYAQRTAILRSLEATYKARAGTQVAAYIRALQTPAPAKDGGK
jgi:recombinational DNA repair ATPase RecF